MLKRRDFFGMACASVFAGCASNDETPIVRRAPALEGYALPGPLFHQRDPRWGALPLGKSRHTVASSCCTLCCVAMAFSHLGVETNPASLTRFLNKTNGFTSSGDLIWAASAAYGGGRLAVDYIGAADPSRIDQSLARKRPVIAEVYLEGRYQHWVLIVGKIGDEYLVRDPLDTVNSVKRLSDVAPGIRAIRIFRRA